MHRAPVPRLSPSQPATSIVNTIRDLFTQQLGGNDVRIALAWCAGFIVVAYTLAMVTYRCKVA